MIEFAKNVVSASRTPYSPYFVLEKSAVLQSVLLGYEAICIGCPRSGHYVFNKLDQGLSQMILMVIIKV